MLARWSNLLNVSLWSCFVFSCLAQQLQNITITNTSPQIDYTPFICNVSGSASFSPSCLGGWQVLTSGGETILSTEGAGPQGADIVPQMFLRFQASALFLNTSTSSNATFDISVSVGNSSVSVSANSSVGAAAIFNLPENETTTLSLTFTAGQIPSHLDIGNITIEVADNSLSSILPTQTLPPSVFLPTFVPSTSAGSSTSTPSNTSSAQSSASKHQQLVADAVGLTLGLGLGLTLITMLGYLAWKRRRRRQGDIDWRRTGNTQGKRTLGFIRNNRNSTQWF